MSQRQDQPRASLEPLERRALLSESNVLAAAGAGVQNNPSIAIDPLNARHIVVSYLDQALEQTGYEGIGVAVSLNGGATWQRTAVPLPVGYAQGAAAPKTVFDGQGHIFVSFMSATFLATQPALTNADAADRPDGFQANNGVFIARSDDGGLTWGTPVPVVSHLYGGTHPVPYETFPDLAIDSFRTLPNGRANPYYGDLYVTDTRLYPAGQFPGDATSSGGGAVMLSVSTDGGRTWHLREQPQTDTGVPVTVIGPNDPYFTGKAPLGLTGQTYAQLTVGPAGDVYVDYYLFGYDAVVRSTDNGVSFNAVDLATNAGLPFSFGSYLGYASPLSSRGGPNGAGGPANNFRTVPVRDVIADPSRPGTVYVAEMIGTSATDGSVLDYGDVFFARSTDYGVTWTSSFKVNGARAEVLNDDNGGRPSQGRPSDVADAQAMPEMAIDAQGDLAVIWYDTRSDPNNHLLSVYGTVSTDGGRSFGANFVLSGASFDANAGAFTDAKGATTYFLGDRIGLSIRNGAAVAAWTDTSAGSQDIRTADFAVASPPAAENDRFGPNATAATATILGTVVERVIPKLRVAAGQAEWFSVTAAATGRFVARVSPNDASAAVDVALFADNGRTLLASGAALRDGGSLQYAATAGETYLLRVTPTTSATTGYALAVQSLTTDLGTVVAVNVASTLAAADQDLYRVTAPSAGTVTVKLTPGAAATGTFAIDLLDPSHVDALGSPVVLLAGDPVPAGRARSLTLGVTQGQSLLLRVSSIAGAAGAFTLRFANADAFSATAATALPFPAGDGPSQVVTADVNGDGADDLIVSDALANTVSVLLSNNDGTFESPRSFDVGAFKPGNAVTTLSLLPTYKRGLAVGDFNGDGRPDIVVTNTASGDLSVLLGRGDGTFTPQVRYDAGSTPNVVTVADFNGDNVPDLAVLSASTGNSDLAILIGRGDGTFLPAVLYISPVVDSESYDNLLAADVTGDGKVDLVLTGGADQKAFLYTGRGDGSFALSVNAIGGGGPPAALADATDDGITDLVQGNFANSTVTIEAGAGDGTFGDPDVYKSGEAPLAVAVADIGSPVDQADGSVTLGAPDGVADLILADSGAPQTAFTGPAEIVMLPAIVDADGFEGYDDQNPIRLAAAKRPSSLAVGKFGGDGKTDVAYVDSDGVHVIYPQTLALPHNDTAATARNLGTVVHVLEPTLTITPAATNAYFTLTVPTEAAANSRDEIVSFSGNFSATSHNGVTMQVRDAAGVRLGSGSHFDIVARQGERLTIRVYGKAAAAGSAGSGAYALDVDVRPQLVSVTAEGLLLAAGGQPAGAKTSLVLTFQGDRLAPDAAQDVGNYSVTFLGDGGDRTPHIASAVYDPSVNVVVTSGLTYPTAVRQTVTLLFDAPLTPGTYAITVAPAIAAVPFNDQEDADLIAANGSVGHSVASIANQRIVAGVSVVVPDLVLPPSGPLDFPTLKAGTPFLTQLQADLAAVLDANLTATGDQPTLTATLLQQITRRFEPNLAQADLPPFVVLFLDPVSLNLVDPDHQRVDYQLQTGKLLNQTTNAYVNVAGNVEVVVMPLAAGTYDLQLANASTNSRGGVAILGGNVATQTIAFTDAIRDGQRDFQFGVDSIRTPTDNPADNLDLRPAIYEQSQTATHQEAKPSVATLIGTDADAVLVSAAIDIAPPQVINGFRTVPRSPYADGQSVKPTTQPAGADAVALRRAAPPQRQTDVASGHAQADPPTTQPAEKSAPSQSDGTGAGAAPVPSTQPVPAAPLVPTTQPQAIGRSPQLPRRVASRWSCGGLLVSATLLLTTFAPGRESRCRCRRQAPNR